MTNKDIQNDLKEVFPYLYVKTATTLKETCPSDKTLIEVNLIGQKL